MSEDPSRGFDWGPPDAGRFESLKEWGVYALLVLLIGAGIWFLVDAASPGIQPGTLADAFPRATIRPPLETSSAKNTDASQLGHSVSLDGVVTPAGPASLAVPLPAAKPVFLIQLGAFGEEQAALDAQTRLRKKGYVASLTVPDAEYELYRVLLGPFSDEKQADDTARKLNEMDFPCFVIESL
ncbi:MAG TPA: SPOR domain-containing protein [Candidatus Ozemobacteraceae bacterium]|mgnify:CR=1 FL=1|nr:SPOR domain-containing protein [Candidatus Ozemobacteraceae bacterium]